MQCLANLPCPCHHGDILIFVTFIQILDYFQRPYERVSTIYFSELDPQLPFHIGRHSACIIVTPGAAGRELCELRKAEIVSVQNCGSSNLRNVEVVNPVL